MQISVHPQYAQWEAASSKLFCYYQDSLHALPLNSFSVQVNSVKEGIVAIIKIFTIGFKLVC